MVRVLMVAGLFFAVAGCRGWREIVPAGASIEPWLFNSFEGGTIRTPSGGELRVVFNYGGAAHSGHHWTWIVAHDWLWGLRIVAQGYCEHTDSPPHVAWNADGTGEVTFAARRRDDAQKRVRFRP